MSLQYTYDTKGNPIGVFVPINEWEKITSQLKKSKSSKKTISSKKKMIFNGIKKGLKEVEGIQKGKIKPISLKQLLDEL
jgi:hypothetical protein